MNGLREECHCGHDIDTHHERKDNCLAARCDCPFYRDQSKRDSLPRVTRKPNHPARCLCFYCNGGG